MKLNIVVATYNRSANLRDLLEGLLRCETSSSCDWDVIVVDNNSKDATREIVKEFGERDPEHFKYLFEGKKGKAYALNLGIRKSSGDVVVFTDDDCIPDAHWIENIAREFSSRADLGVLGGRIELYDPRDLPITIRTSRERLVLSNGAGVFSFIAGCNMAIRREVLQRVGPFDTKLGPGSPKDTVADDPDYVYRAFRSGAKVEYVPDILVHHNHGRRSDLDAQNLKRKYLRGRGAFYAKHILRGDRTVLKMAYWELRPLILAAFARRGPSESVRIQRESLRHLLAGMASRVLP
ncbi:MAG: glycosyltransferase family 2 protein [Candidatus Acidiferrum sp.]